MVTSYWALHLRCDSNLIKRHYATQSMLNWEKHGSFMSKCQIQVVSSKLCFSYHLRVGKVELILPPKLQAIMQGRPIQHEAAVLPRQKLEKKNSKITSTSNLL